MTTPQLPTRVQTVVYKLLSSRVEKDVTHSAIALIKDMAKQIERYKPSRLRISVQDQTVTRHGVTIKLSPSQTSALHCMWESGEIVSVEQLAKAVYGPIHKDRNINTMRVHMTDLRKRLDPINVDVVNVFGRGYRLEIF